MPLQKPIATITILLFLACSASAQPSIKEIRTASNNVVVVYFMGEDIEGVDTNKEKWQVNDVTPGKIDKWITPNWSGIDFSYEHHIYLTMPEHLISGKEYQVKTPHGEETFIFNEEDIFCESIKTNQSAYSALATVRYANFSIWQGTGGGKDIDGIMPAYEVIELKHKKKIASGTLRKLGPNKNSGDTIYQIDLSEVPVGGPYKIVLKGYGSSHPFGVGGDFSDRLAYVQFRGLLHQRCGMEQKKPFFEHDIRETCHTVTYLPILSQRKQRLIFPMPTRLLKHMEVIMTPETPIDAIII